MKNSLFLLLAATVALLNLGCNKDEIAVSGNTEIYLEITGAETLTVDEVITGADYFVSATFAPDDELFSVELIRFLGGFSLEMKGVKPGKFEEGTYTLFADEASTFRSSNQSPTYQASSGSIEVTATGNSIMQGAVRANIDVRFTMADINDPSRVIEIEGYIRKFDVFSN